tara:strand:+ start:444 stop:1151 length:708 start_codon:yes stop_codon:yes gene_type:complete
MKKKKKRIKKPTYPQQLNREDHFKCPIWLAEQPEFVDALNKASDKYILASRENIQPDINKRNKLNKTKGDLGSVYHSTTLIRDPNFKDLLNYIGATSQNLLIEMGFDMTNHQLFTTEMWVQEFAKNGGGHHTLHTHWNGHMSGFYFLKASDKTSMPMFEDPRAGNVMNLLPEKDKSKVTYASSVVHYKAQPGRMIFFPSYMPHQYVVDMGVEPFRFIHWNCQAIPKGVLNVIQKK